MSLLGKQKIRQNKELKSQRVTQDSSLLENENKLKVPLESPGHLAVLMYGFSATGGFSTGAGFPSVYDFAVPQESESTTEVPETNATPDPA